MCQNQGLVNCLCHRLGILEIKCSWIYPSKRFMFGGSWKSYKNKRNHIYIYNIYTSFKYIQCQIRHVTNRYWCDFYLCTTKESSLEWIDFDLELFMFNIQNAKLVYEQNVMPEILCRTLKTDIEIEQDVKQNVLGKVVDCLIYFTRCLLSLNIV